MVLNSKENQQSKMYNDDKENNQNSSKLTKLENNVKNYETLVTELNKLTAEEQIVRDKLFKREWKVCFILMLFPSINVLIHFNIQEAPVQCKRSVPIAKPGNSEDLDTVTHSLDTQLNVIKSKETGKYYKLPFSFTCFIKLIGFNSNCILNWI